MTFAELQTELYARGLDYFNQDAAGRTRAKRYLNSARAEFDRMFLWPWRQATTSGAAPLAVSDLGPIQSVVDSTGASLRRIEAYGDLTNSGSPWAYYVDWSSGSRSVATFPTTTDTITVNYWKVTPDLSADSDTPVSPSEAHYLIVDLAVRRAYRDSDNHQEAEAIQSEIDRQLDALLFQYQPGTADGPDAFVGVTQASDDW